jgi:hypothetical protein
MNPMTRFLAALLTSLAAATLALAGSAAASESVGPNQHYLGLVNGKNAGAVIYVVCPGPAGPNRTGPPAGGQNVKVVQVASGGGFTGSFAHEIWAVFNHNASPVVGFTTYNTAKPIPTTLHLPCGGKGTVTFTTCFDTLPCAANAKDDVVPVTFLNIAV